MARDGNGNYSRPVAPYVFDTDILENDVNLEMDQIATAITDSIAKDGQTIPTANLPMGGYKHTNVAAAAVQTDYLRADQAQKNTAWLLTNIGGTADAITGTAALGMSALVAGMTYDFVPTADNTATAPTLNISGTGAKVIKKNGGDTLAPGDIKASKPAQVFYTGTYYELLNPVNKQVVGTSGQFLRSDGTDAAWSTITGADIVDDGSGNLTATELLAVKTGSYTLVSGDRRKHFYFALTAVATCTVPSAAISGNRWSTKISNASNSSDALQVTSASGNFYGGSIVNVATFHLYPGESCVITSSGGIWIISAWQRSIGKTFAYGSFKAATSATIRTGTATDEAATPSALKTNIRPLLATLTASNSSALAFTGFDSTKYAGYEVYFEQLLPATTSVKLDVYVSTDGGSSYLSSGYEWNVLRCDLANAAGNGSNADSKARLVADLDVSNAIPLSGFMIVSIGSGAYNFSYNGSMRYRPSNFVSNQFAGTNTSSTIINAIKWQFSSGNIASGVVRVYGIPK